MINSDKEAEKKEEASPPHLHKKEESLLSKNELSKTDNKNKAQSSKRSEITPLHRHPQDFRNLLQDHRRFANLKKLLKENSNHQAAHLHLTAVILIRVVTAKAERELEEIRKAADTSSTQTFI